ncbi:MAG TPA: SGNH/GDSL hydrolase family protein [Acidobacteriaceae bacterium]|nr:SGNH/GDSL hydrolase family protein [Acidobacteriaceae bacterium]
MSAKRPMARKFPCPQQCAGACALAVALLLPSALHAQTAPLALHSGDRVVFYGDSITAQRRYTRFVEDFIVSRYPQMRIDFYNAGVSGDTAEGGHAGDMETRVKRDVLPLHPTVVTIMLGMNDGRYTTDFPKNFEAYKTGYRRLVDTLRRGLPGVRLLFIWPSPYDEIAHPPAIVGYNTVMVRYGDFVAQLGQELGVPVVDFNAAVDDALKAGMKIDPRMAGSLLPDRIHPAEAGHWIMAATLVRGWNVTPTVSTVDIDAARTQVATQQNTAVTGLTESGTEVKWTQLDQALPLPLELNDAMTQFLLEISDIPSLDRQIVQVTGLSAASYNLTIDDQQIGTFSRQELASGINLALYSTPMEQQAKSIDWTADDRSKLSGTRFDLITEGDTLPGEADGVRTLDALDAKMIDDEYHNAQPKPHTFTLTARP